MLGNRLPISYRSFIATFGAGDVQAIEILGILNDPKLDKDGGYNAVAYTLSLRKDHRLPDNFVIVGFTDTDPTTPWCVPKVTPPSRAR
ncbi:MAG: SMI1/KNR4 family protein [Bacteroidetes bacterium]|nr:SMI1/KNR4 family protein [Bacteroidota bacterium]